MKHIARAFAFALGLSPLAAMAQSAPANLPANTVYGRLGFPGTVGPGQAVPLPNLQAAIGFNTNIATPEAYGAPHDGVHDDGPAIDAALLNLSLRAGGGTLQLSCGTTYTISTVSPNSRSAVRLFSNVNIVGCGDSSVIKMANGLNTSSAFVWGLYATGTANNVRYSNFTIDMNGANNSCGGTCYFSNAALGIAIGNDISVDHVRFINNPGSNDTVFGQAVVTPTVSNLHLSHLVHAHYGDIVNPASLDFSADFFIAKNVTVDDILYSDGPRVNGAAWEFHGDGIAASNLVVNDNFACGIIAGEVGEATNNVTITNVKCNNVKQSVIVAAKSGSALTNIAISNLVTNYLSGSSGIGVDACNYIDPAASTLTNLTITGSVFRSSVQSNLGNDAPGICVGPWLSANIVGNQTYNTQGPGLYFLKSAAGAALTVVGNTFTYPGWGGNAALEAGVVVAATSGVTAGVIDIKDNTINGTVVNGVIGAQNATGGQIMGNDAPGNTGGQVNYTGTGVFTYLFPGASGTLAAINVGETFTANQRFADGTFKLNGATSGDMTLHAAAVAGTNSITWPAATTDFSATGGTSQFVKQNSAGGALTPTRPVCGDLSNAGTACQANTGTSGATVPLLNGNNSFSGQIISTFGTPTIASGACGTGTNGTISGTNQSGTITIGAVATTSCTVSFSATITAPSSCHLTPGNAAAAQAGTTGAFAGTPGTTSWAITGLALANTVYRYLCL